MVDTTQKQIEGVIEIKRKSPDINRVSKEAWIIEETLRAFGINSRVAEVNLKKSGFEYFLQIEHGTPTDSVVKLDKEIALAVHSPTGKVKIQVPILGTYYIGILIPPGKLPN